MNYRNFFSSSKRIIIFGLAIFLVASGGYVFWKRSDFSSKKFWRKFTNTGENENNTKHNNLRGLGYVSGSKKATGESGILRHDFGRTYSGLNLYTSGHAPEAMLMSMDGETVHRWALSWSEAFPETDPREVTSKYDQETTMERASYWRKVHPYPNGDLLVIFSSLGIVKIDRNSNVLWKKINKAHHDVDVSSDGKIYLLTRDIKGTQVGEEVYPYVNEKIAVLNKKGEKIKEFSLTKRLLASKYSGVVENFSVESEEVFIRGEKLHTNSVDYIEQEYQNLPSAFRPGNLVISLNIPNNIIVVDVSKEEIVWTLPAMAHAQHEANLLNNGNILFFKNNKYENKKLGWSEVLEVDPVTQEIVWSFKGNNKNGMYSQCCSTNQRLSNGNTLITETEDGRAFEVTESGDIVWEFRSPHRVTKDGEKKIAQLFEVQRLPADYMDNW